MSWTGSLVRVTAPSADPLAPLLDLPGVAEASETARDALARVHRHPANRRGWATTAAESVLRGARSSAGVEGASVRMDEGGPDPERDPVLAAALRVAGELTGDALDRAVAVWTRSPLQELAHLHVLAAGGEDADPDTLGRPRPDAGVGQRLQGLAELVTGGTRAPGPVLAAVVHGEIAALRPFDRGGPDAAPSPADGLVARAASRLVTVSTGLDPHGLGVPEVTWYRRPELYRERLAGYAAGGADGVAAWLRYCCEALDAGAREAVSIADSAGG